MQKWIATGSVLLSVMVTTQAADWYVAPTGGDSPGNGTLPATPFQTIGYAIDAASDGDSLHVDSGTYSESDLFVNKSLTISGAGSGTTTVDATFSGVVFFLYGVGKSIEIEDLSIINGGARDGGGVLCVAATAVLRRCTISGNVSAAYGGGVRNQYGDLRVTQCVLRDNLAVMAGGGAYGCDLDSTLLVYNVSTNGGGAAQCTLRNCTVATNMAASAGGTIDCVAYNSIVYHNAASLASEPSNYKNTVFSDSCSYPLPEGVGNIDANPIFIHPAFDFREFVTSPCINRGNPDYVAEPGAVDLYGVNRQLHDLPDMGASEYTSHFVPARIPVISGMVDFGSVYVGSNATRTLWVLNKGNTNLTVSGLLSPASFFATMADMTVAPGSSNAISVVFTPVQAGSTSGVFQVLTDLTWGESQVTVSGIGAIPPPLIGVSPVLLSVTAVEGANTSNEAVTVLNAAARGEMNFTVVSDSGWITPVPASGVSTGNTVAVTFVFRADTLAYGFYTGKVTVASAAASNSPQVVEVRLRVRPGRAPGKPVPITPVQGSVVAMTNALAFRWTSASRAEQYQVWIGTNGYYFTNAWTTGESATNVTISAGFRTGSYMWMVAGSNWLGYGAWSTTVTFTVVREVSPTGGAILPVGTAPSLRWTETPGVTGYHLVIQQYDKAGAQWLDYRTTNGLSPAGLWVPAAAFPKGSYRWRLQELDGGVWSAWGGWAYFQIALPAFPATSAPASPLYYWKNVSFQWGSVSNATAYQLAILTGGALYFAGPWQSERDASVLLQSFPATYQWHVRARNLSGIGAWSPLVKLVRKPLGNVSGLSPNGLILPQGSLVTFSWNSVPGATKFDLALWRGGKVISTYRLQGVEVRTYTASLPLSRGSYQWQMRPGNSDGWGAWSAQAAFLIQ